MHSGRNTRSEHLDLGVGDDHILDLETASIWMQETQPVLPARRAASSIEGTESTAPSLEEWQRGKEQIASLECIVAILVEKNEWMRQQLALYLN